MLLGDVVHCPAELLSDDWEMIGDVDRQLAQRAATRGVRQGARRFERPCGCNAFSWTQVWPTPQGPRPSTVELWLNSWPDVQGHWAVSVHHHHMVG